MEIVLKSFYVVIVFMNLGNVDANGSANRDVAETLGSYNINRDAISVSGLSSGAFMAVQLHVARSDVFMGVGVVAGGPFYCAESSLSTALTACMTSPFMINLNSLLDNARNQEQKGKVESLSNLNDARVYIFSGRKDTTVQQGVAVKAQDFYAEFVDPGNILTEYSLEAVHGFPTMNYGEPCDQMNKINFINDCDYDGAYHILNQIYGGNLELPDYSGFSETAGSVYMFDQGEFAQGLNPTSMGMYSYGYLFVPTSCEDGSIVCKLHVSLHGCKQTPDLIGDTYVEHTGYKDVAALNNIIVLFPQASEIPVKNPNGCWDWWGYTDGEYSYNDGKQIEAIMKMIERLTEGSSGFPSTTSSLPQSTLTSLPVSTTSKKTTTEPAQTGVVGSYLIDTSAISTSGLSAGGFMAIQLHVAESAVFMGVGAVAGGPYYCALDNVYVATSWCMYMPAMIDVDLLKADAEDYQLDKTIANLDNLKDDRIFLFSGSKDYVVVQGVVQKAEEFYLSYTNRTNIKTEYSIPAQNGFPTMNQGGPCDSLNDDGLNQCNYDAAYEILNHIYGGDLQRPSYTGDEELHGELLQFEQSILADASDPKDVGLDKEGLVFIPNSCTSGEIECRLHVAFHGCKNGDNQVAEAFASSAGYNEVAALNDIIILYPRSTWTLSNPQDCWDWWGYTNKDYATNKGVQIRAIMNMVNYLVL